MFKRKTDSLGRIVLPIQVRREMGIENEKAYFVFELQPDDTLMVRLVEDNYLADRTRKCDLIGRLTLPREILDHFGAGRHEQIEFSMDYVGDGVVILKKEYLSCRICGERDMRKLRQYIVKGVPVAICDECAKAIREEPKKMMS